MFILIAGPTASGKSELAIRTAESNGGIVVNADSMQVYRELRIITARPSVEDEARTPHQLYGHRSSAESYSVAAWLADLVPYIARARAGGPPLTIVGGTGLYFKALLEGLSPVPDIPDAIRDHWRAEAQAKGAANLHEVLTARDAEMAARIRSSDSQRIVRALEVLEATGVSLAHWQMQKGEPLLAEDEVEKLFVSPPRDILYERCDARFDKMMAAGALDEVRQLRDLRLDAGLPVMRALGVRPLLRLLDGEIDLAEAAEQAKTETRRYAKRQLTWAQRNMIAWNSVFLK
ncbi:MAG: tRNA (adenosine(37)-N6)-dimethylallyltransferase MiaA [Alphaproteobacteria bacterium]